MGACGRGTIKFTKKTIKHMVQYGMLTMPVVSCSITVDLLQYCGLYNLVEK